MIKKISKQKVEKSCLVKLCNVCEKEGTDCLSWEEGGYCAVYKGGVTLEELNKKLVAMGLEEDKNEEI